MKSSTILSRSLLLLAALGLGASVAACGDDLTSGSSTSATSSSSGGGGSVTPELQYLAKFDAAKYELPEGLWITPDSKTAYVDFAATGQIKAVSLADDKVADFATVPAPPANKGFVTGITQSPAGDLYVGAATRRVDELVNEHGGGSTARVAASAGPRHRQAARARKLDVCIATLTGPRREPRVGEDPFNGRLRPPPILVRASTMNTTVLSPAEHALLREVRVSDEDHGGLAGEELATDEYDAMERLCELGMVEALGEYGEAPDGEEDEREMGESVVVYRITGVGVLALSETE